MTTKVVENGSTYVHPLLVGTRSTIGSWDAWRKRWDEASTLEERLGLLHVGFSTELGSLSDRIVFYLDVANGHDSLMNGPFGVMNFHERWTYGAGGTNGGTFGWEKSLSEILKIIAKKALSEVSKRYFVLGEYPHSTFQEAEWLNSATIVDKLVWFVQPDEEGRVRNLDRDSHATMVARKFYFELCKLAFEDWTEYSYKSQGNLPAISKLLIPKRAQLIPVLGEVGDVRWLLRPEVVHLLDDECVAALTKLALNNKGSFPGERERRAPTTVVEAAYLGSPSAHVLLMREIVLKEKERLEKRADLIRQREEAEKALEQI